MLLHSTLQNRSWKYVPLCKTDTLLKTTVGMVAFYTYNFPRADWFFATKGTVCKSVDHIFSFQDVTLRVKRCSCWPKRRPLIFPLPWRYSSLCQTLAQGTQSGPCSLSHAVIYWSLPHLISIQPSFVAAWMKSITPLTPLSAWAAKHSKCHCDTPTPPPLLSEGC